MEADRPLSTLTQATYERIRLDILECRLRPDARLKIKDLCGALSVSLSAVREALSRLVAEGLVLSEPQRGFRVAPISVEDLKDLSRTRTEIEALCIRSSIANGDLRWESQLVAAFHRLVRTNPNSENAESVMSCDWGRAHTDFHEAMAAACDSPRLSSLRRLLHLQNERYRRIATRIVDCTLIDAEHRALMDAALARDAELTVALMTEHVTRTANTLISVVEASRAAVPPVSPRNLAATRRLRLSAGEVERVVAKAMGQPAAVPVERQSG